MTTEPTIAEMEAGRKFLRNAGYVADALASLERLYDQQMENFHEMTKGLRRENEELKAHVEMLEKALG